MRCSRFIAYLRLDLTSCLPWYNGEAFALGSIVRAGAELLKCERGTWVRVGEQRPD